MLFPKLILLENHNINVYNLQKVLNILALLLLFSSVIYSLCNPFVLCEIYSKYIILASP